MPNEFMTLDTDYHRTDPFFDDGGELHALLPDGGKRVYRIARLKTWVGRDDWGYLTEVETVGVTPDRRWLLVTTSAEDSEVEEFASRLELCKRLAELIDIEPAALNTLYRLGAVHLEPALVKHLADEKRKRRRESKAARKAK
jgi:hypothetical protein